MDVGEKKKSDSEKRNEKPRLPSDCRFGGGNFVNPASMSSIADSYGVWDNPGNSQPYNSSVNQIGLAGGVPVLGSLRIRPDAGWQDPNSAAKGGFLLPGVSGSVPHLSQLPTDSAFIERAARFSCFNSGNMADLMSSFPMYQAVSPYHQLTSMLTGPMEGFMDAVTRAAYGEEPQKNETNPPSTSKDEGSPQVKNTRCCAEAKQTESDEAESFGGRRQDDTSLMDTATEPSLAKGFGPKRRKRAGQDTEPEQSKQLSGEDANDIGKQSSPPPKTKTTVKNGKSNPQGSDASKEEYIHIRARRGQATNSHSLAERIRRERISERMKFLQDLVPDCSKVTGKAVMLDEIINYVQSLQRQVEFLSMKLATVDPRADFNIDSLLAKDQMFPTLAAAGPSSSVGFSPDVSMAYHSMHSQPTSIHPSLPIIRNASDALRNLNPPLCMNEGYRESTPQMPNVWDYDLQNVVQMGYDPTAPVDNQDTTSSLPPAHMKVEP